MRPVVSFADKVSEEAFVGKRCVLFRNVLLVDTSAPLISLCALCVILVKIIVIPSLEAILVIFGRSHLIYFCLKALGKI